MKQDRNLENLLQECERRYNALFENMLDGGAYCRMLFDEADRPVDFVYLQVNKMFTTITGLKDVVGKRVSEVIPGIQDSNPKLFEIYGNVASTGQPGRFEEHIDLLGTWFSVAVYSPSKSHFIAVFSDITERKRVEMEVETYKKHLENLVNERTEELRKSNAFLSSVLENIPDMIFVKDAKDLKFVRFNKAGEDLIGHSRDELLGRNDYDFFPKPQADFFTFNDRNVLAGGKVLDIPEEPISTLHWGERILHTKKIPIYNKTGEAEYLLGISEDITEKKAMEGLSLKLFKAQVAQEEGQKGIVFRDDFIAVASHELKTPLTSLKMQLQILLRLLQPIVFPEKEKFLGFYENARRQLDQFSRLVDDLLDLSRLGTVHPLLETGPVLLAEVIARVLEQCRPDLNQVGCVVTTDLAPGILGRWDSFRIEQVVANLLSNAMKYGAGKPILIETRADGNHAILRVQDHGIGISKEDQQKIFGRYERRVPVTRYRGLGLGLFIVRQIVEAHGGTIRVLSEPEQGATFIVELPITNDLV